MKLTAQIILGATIGGALAFALIWSMTTCVRAHFDRKREREAEELIRPDLPAIHDWKIRVTHNIDKRRENVGRRANLAHLRIERARRVA